MKNSSEAPDQFNPGSTQQVATDVPQVRQKPSQGRRAKPKAQNPGRGSSDDQFPEFDRRSDASSAQPGSEFDKPLSDASIPSENEKNARAEHAKTYACQRC